jgi:hypothetical protein
MSLSRVKQFTLKNGEWPGSIVAHQSGYTGGMPARVNSAAELARAYDDTGYVGIYAKGSDVDVSGDPVTFYAGPGLFTLQQSAGEAAASLAYPYDETLTYVPGESVGILAGRWVNAGQTTNRARVMGVGTVSGGITTSLTLLFF